MQHCCVCEICVYICNQVAFKLKRMKLILQKPDTVGALASSLCLVHCLATPVLFIAHACSDDHFSAAPFWWKWIDYVFLIVSFYAVFRSTRNSKNKLVKFGMWISWLILFLAIIIETFELMHLPEMVLYTAALILVILHLYNLKYCQCNPEKDNCCLKNE